MFSKLALFAAATMAVFVSALPGGSGIVNSCNGGQNYCCNDVQPATSSAAQEAILLAGILAPIAGTVGLTCTPVNIIAVSKQSCTSQSVCCSGNDFNGAVVEGCNPIHVGGP